MTTKKIEHTNWTGKEENKRTNISTPVEVTYPRLKTHEMESKSSTRTDKKMGGTKPRLWLEPANDDDDYDDENNSGWWQWWLPDKWAIRLGINSNTKTRPETVFATDYSQSWFQMESKYIQRQRAALIPVALVVCQIMRRELDDNKTGWWTVFSGCWLRRSN